MSEELDKIEQIINDIRSLENTRYMQVFQRRYVEVIREIASKRSEGGKSKKRITPMVSEEEKARRHKENLKKRPPGWATLPTGRTVNATKKNDKLPPNMPRNYGIDVYKSGPINRRLSDWQEKDPDQRKWSVMRNE